MIELGEATRLVFSVGVGGVGKTTFAAALGLQEALRGRSVLVLTADPARRLADALGIDTLHDVASTVPLSDAAPGGELHAAMLETKASADSVILRAVDDEAQAARVFENKVYQAFSNSLGRSHAYAAMERVRDAVHDPQYDLVIVDTPPSQSALEIFDAPARLVRFLDQRVVRWFLQSPDDAPRLSGGPIARRLLSLIGGESLVAALADFLSEVAFLREGFAERAKDLRDIMRSPQTEFILVSSADAAGVRTAESVAEEVEKRDFFLSHVVFNRAFIDAIELGALDRAQAPRALADVAPVFDRMRSWVSEEQRAKQASIEQFCHGRKNAAWMLPEATRPLGDTSALMGWFSSGRGFEQVA